MSFDTILDGASVGYSASAADSTEILGRTPAPGSGAGATGRVEFGTGVWIECHERSGVVLIRDPRLFRPGCETFCRAIAESAVETFQARRVEVCLTSSLCRLEFKPGQFDRAGLARLIAASLTAATASIRDRTAVIQDATANWTTLTVLARAAGRSTRQAPEDRPGRVHIGNTPGPPEPTSAAHGRASRLVDLAAAGGSLTMAVAGVILPGIPSMPFWLLTVRHVVRLSPPIERVAGKRPLLAALLSQAEQSGNFMRFDWRSTMKMLAITAVGSALYYIFQPPLPILIGLEIGVMTFIALRKMGRPARQALALGLAA